MIAHPDSVGAFAAGFVNSYASGYAADTLTCWVILTAWIAFEAKTKGVRHGWICALLGVVPGGCGRVRWVSAAAGEAGA